MKRTNIHRALAVFVLGLVATAQVYAQYMPVVFDKKYGDNNKIEHVCPLVGDEVAMVGKEGQKFNLTWVDREGEVVFSMPLTGFASVNQLTELDDNRLLIVGQSAVVNKVKDKKDITLCGRVVIMNRSGNTVTNVYAGSQGSEIMKGALLRSGALLVSGSEPKASGRQGFIMKVDKDGKVLYQYRNVESGYCAHFEVLGNTTEYVCAVFSSSKDKEKSAIVRLDDRGKPYYITPLPAVRFEATALSANINDGSVVLTGNSPIDGGVVYKIRPEGDVVFGKTLIPATENAKLNHLNVARNGNILLGGTGNKGYYALLRTDGTALYSGVGAGVVSGVGMNASTGESVVTTYDLNARRGSFVRISSTGKAEFTRTIEGNFDNVKVSNNGEILLLSSAEGRVSMYSATGNKEFDRFITDNKPTMYREALSAASGEVLFLGAGSRLVKLGHGLYVSDVKITKPVNGIATAIFTVTLTGYATTKEGAPIPVSVDYKTREVSATTTNNFTPVQGKLSFTPSRGTADRYLIKQDIEVAVKANNLVEGIKEFDLALSGVQQSYLVKPVGKAIIEDHQAIVKLVRTESGIEGSKDILYELGLFKTDGTPLTNSTGANIIVDGTYGEGTADALDFDMGLTPRAIFTNSQQRATFSAKTLEDTRYELPKTVVINFNKIHNLSGSNLAFDGDLLSCSGIVVDQPAKVAITSLGDHRINNSAVSGFFTVSLLRASDGALQTNVTGNDIVVNCAVMPDASAKEGKDFVFTNIHDLRISGDGNHSSANINGVVLYSTDAVEKLVKLQVKSVNHPAKAQPITVSETERVAEFTIRK
ncbi:Calx-beta domain-containing protein [Bacteroides sp. 51]|uniref:Calx-beta domain-containing protein n=1 Tax=Bacteroides sp. 51 TaxID=2302938 RepID=UPI0013D5D32B|nr:Calx-beta domain-containing protein [Bacteroides sp. 51]NDV84136.1 hypothetical protein [Bacteroides sp. 51]